MNFKEILRRIKEENKKLIFERQHKAVVKIQAFARGRIQKMRFLILK